MVGGDTNSGPEAEVILSQTYGAFWVAAANVGRVAARHLTVIRGATAKDPRRRYDGMWPFARAIVDLRERLVADPEAAELLRHRPPWELQHPIARDPEGRHQYRGPR